MLPSHSTGSSHSNAIALYIVTAVISIYGTLIVLACCSICYKDIRERRQVRRCRHRDLESLPAADDNAGTKKEKTKKKKKSYFCSWPRRSRAEVAAKEMEAREMDRVPRRVSTDFVGDGLELEHRL